MKFGKLYTEAISLTPEERESKGLQDKDGVNPQPFSPAEDAASSQEKLNWLASPVTSSLLKELGNEINDAINEAIKLSIGYSSHNNPLRIIQLLNKAHELKQIIKRYGRN